MPGGVESILGAHARLLREAGHDVRVIAGRGDAEIVPEVDSRHPMVERVATGLASGADVSAEFESLRARLASRLGPLVADRDLVIAHNVMTMPFNLPLAAALTGLGRPVLAWTHDLAWVNPRYVNYRRESWPCSILREAVPGVSYVAISAVMRLRMSATFGLPGDAVPVVPNGIDVEGFLGVSEETLDLTRRGRFEGADPLVLVPARITPRKRIELAVEAARALRATHPRLRLVVSGPLGPHSAGNRAYAASLVELRGRLGLEPVVRLLFELAEGGGHPVSERAIADLYRMADCVLLPSESEGFGLPVLEAGLTRAPLVCTDIEVLTETAGIRDAILTFPADGGAGAVADAVGRALSAPAVMLRARVVREFGWAAVLERMQELIASLVG